MSASGAAGASTGQREQNQARILGPGARPADPAQIASAGRLALFREQNLRIVDINTPDQVQQLVDEIYALELDSISLDFETAREPGKDYGVHKGSLRVVQVGFEHPTLGARQYLIDCWETSAEPLARVLGDKSVEKVIHHSRFEQEWAHFHLGTPMRNVWDTHAAWQSVQKILGQMLKDKDQGRAAVDAVLPGWERTDMKLGTLVRMFHGFEIPKEEQGGEWESEFLNAAQREYAAMDVALLPEVARELKKLVAALKLEGEVRQKAGNISRQKREYWTPERMDARDSSREVAWEMVYAQSAQEIDDQLRMMRRRCLCAASRRQLERFGAQRRAELLAA